MKKFIQLGRNGKRYERISRTKAKDLYNRYEKIYCCAKNESPYRFGTETELQRRIEAEDYRPLVEDIDEFDRVVRALEKWQYKGTVWFWAETKQNQKIN